MQTSAGAPDVSPGPVRSPAVRLAVAGLDGFAVILLTLVLSVVLFGGLRLVLGTTRLSATSATPLLGLLALVSVVRHIVAPRPSIFVRTRQALAAARLAACGATMAVVAPIWIATRLGVILVAFAAVVTVGLPPNVSPPKLSGNALWNLPFRWDTGWYLTIALDGYRWNPSDRGQQNIAFFPAYPLLMRTGGALLGARSGSPHLPAIQKRERFEERTLAAGWLLALGASFAALCALYRWASAVAGPRTAARAVALCSAYPFAVYFSGAYTEPLFLLGTLAAFNAMRLRQPVAVGAWGLFIGLLRPNGFLVALPLMWMALQHGRGHRRLQAASVMPCVGALIFSVYLWSLTGRPLAWMEAHATWGRTPPTWDGSVTQPLSEVADTGLLGYAMLAPYQVMNGAALLFAIALLPAVWRRLGTAPALLVAVTILPPLAAGGLMSMGRLTSTLFPLSVALAAVVPRRHFAAWLMAFGIGEGLAAVLFFTWRPLV